MIGELPWNEANSFGPVRSPLLAWLDRTDMVLPHSVLAGLVAGALATALLLSPEGARSPWTVAALVTIALASFGSALDLWWHGWRH